MALTSTTVKAAGRFNLGGNGFTYGALTATFGSTTEGAVLAALPVPDETFVHPGVPCLNYAGEEGTYRHFQLKESVRWGDLVLSFNRSDQLVGYVYGPPRFGSPAAGFHGAGGDVTLGTAMSVVVADPAVRFNSTPSPSGYLWFSQANPSGPYGIASAFSLAASVTHIWAGASGSCFWLPVAGGPGGLPPGWTYPV